MATGRYCVWTCAVVDRDDDYSNRVWINGVQRYLTLLTQVGVWTNKRMERWHLKRLKERTATWEAREGATS